MALFSYLWKEEAWKDNRVGGVTDSGATLGSLGQTNGGSSGAKAVHFRWEFHAGPDKRL